MKADCFAYMITVGGRRTCTCLETMVCKDSECSFYKPFKQYEADLMRIHGTTDMKKIGATYAAGKANNETV